MSPFEAEVEEKVKFVKMMMIHNGADFSELDAAAMKAVDELIRAVVTIMANYEAFERLGKSLRERT